MKKINVNPKGIKATDCVIRALAYAMDKSWDEVYKDLCDLGMKMKRMPNEQRVYEKYLEQQGWEKHRQPRAYDYLDGNKDTMSKYTVNEFAEMMSGENRCLGKGKIIITVANHMTCIEVNDKWQYEIVDTWDCGYKCVSNYWTNSLSFDR